MKRPVPVGRSPAITLCDASEKPKRTRVVKNRDKPVLVGDLGRETRLRKGLFSLSAGLRYDYDMITIGSGDMPAQGRFDMFMKSLAIIMVSGCLTSTALAQDESDEPVDDSSSGEQDSMGSDFSSVRVHTDSTASEATESLGARAYSSGNHVTFGNSPSSGSQLLGHELTHTVQQQQSTATETDDEQEEDAQPQLQERPRIDSAADRRRVRRSRPDND